MSNTRFVGRMFIDSTRHPMTPAHLNYVQGWTSKYAQENPQQRHYLLLVTPLSQTSVELELYDPADMVDAHLETGIAVIQTTIFIDDIDDGDDGGDDPGPDEDPKPGGGNVIDSLFTQRPNFVFRQRPPFNSDLDDSQRR